MVDLLYKILLLGDFGIGKSTCINLFGKDIVQPFPYPTIGMVPLDFLTKTVTLNGKTTKLQIWDTGGAERFGRFRLSSAYYRVHGIFLVYDITDENSFNSLDNWLQEIRKFALKNVNIILLGSKCDLTVNRKINFQKGKDFADNIGISFFETSSFLSININLAFATMISEIESKTPEIIKDLKITPNEKEKSNCY